VFMRFLNPCDKNPGIQETIILDLKHILYSS